MRKLKIPGFTVRLVEQGDAYGRDNCLTHGEPDPLVEFWKGDYFVSRYYASTLLEFGGEGICLDGGNTYIPRTDVDASGMDKVYAWLKSS